MELIENPLFAAYRQSTRKFKKFRFGYRITGSRVSLTVSLADFSKSIFRDLDAGLAEDAYNEQYYDMLKVLTNV